MNPLKADVLTRQDVRVSRKFGTVTRKDCDEMIGTVWPDKTAYGADIFKGHCGDLSGWAFSREGAIESVLTIYNMSAKAQAYDLAIKVGKI